MENPWVERKARMPTKEDADAWGCVLVWDVNNGVMMCGWNNEMNLCREPVTHWMTPPKGPQKEGQRIEEAHNRNQAFDA